MSLTDSEISLVRQAFRLAKQAVICDIESECSAIDIAGVRWWDTRHMLDEREHSNAVLDMAAEALSFAQAAGVIVRHPSQSHLVRIVGFTQVSIA